MLRAEGDRAPRLLAGYGPVMVSTKLGPVAGRPDEGPSGAGAYPACSS